MHHVNFSCGYHAYKVRFSNIPLEYLKKGIEPFQIEGRLSVLLRQCESFNSIILSLWLQACLI